ncbi:MAG: ParB/RepB/Spo0J family partition protein [Christensenellales bacterium]
MNKKNALGRGLDALLPEGDYQGSVRDIAVTDIDINRDQPRKAFSQESLQGLADSIREVGILQPILVRQVRNRFLIIAGERRFRAAVLAGLRTVPCIQKDLDGLELRLTALIENLQREDLNPMEEAAAISALMAEGSLTQQDAAQRLGKSRPAVANLLRLLNLPASVQQLVSEGSLSEGHARVLAGLKSSSQQESLALQAISQGLSVRQLEALCQGTRQPGKKAAPAPLASELADFAQRLQRATGLRTTIQGSLQEGRIVLRYHSPDELDAFYQALEQILP